MEPSNRFRDLTVSEFVGRLASPDPVPGGGSAAAIAGSLAAGLVTMVASLSTGRPRYSVHAALHGVSLTAGRELADRLLALADEDAEAYAGFGAAMKLPRETDEERAARAEAIDRAAGPHPTSPTGPSWRAGRSRSSRRRSPAGATRTRRLTSRSPRS